MREMAAFLGVSQSSLPVDLRTIGWDRTIRGRRTVATVGEVD